MTPVLSRLLALDRIGASGAALTVRADPPECAAVAVRLQVPGVASLACSFRLRRVGESVIEAAGVLDAVATQVCVVSLEEFAQPIHETFTLHFVPAGAEVTIFAALADEGLQVERVRAVDLEPEFLIAHTARNERFIMLYEDVRAVRLGSSSTAGAGYAG